MALTKLKSGNIGYYKYYMDVTLGKGNFATVYLARHRLLGCEVALKAINISDIEEDYVYRNLHREAQILRELRHPNIIRLYETVSTIKLYCLSLELIRGANLYQFLKKQEDHRISEKLARVFFYQILSAVEYMHRLHYIHRDLKLENILIEYGNVIKIADFGLSNSYFPSFELRTHCGSVEYAAPELFRSASYGTAVDLWSLGVVLYAMVVGKMPFIYSREQFESVQSMQLRQRFVQRISKGLMQENWELMEDLSPDCWNLLHDLLQPDQFRRIRIEDALSHHWITKDIHLKKRLPPKRNDLQRKFHDEIIEYLADKLNTSVSRIEKHLNAYQYDRISCMFYIVRDVLVKEALYPPAEFQTSFLYRFQCWRESRKLLTTAKHFSYGNRSFKDRYYFSEKSLGGSSSTTDSKFQYSSKISSKSRIDNSLKQNSDARTDPPESTDDTEKNLAGNQSNSGTNDVDSNNIKKVEENISHKPYRSYKSSRPVNKTKNLKDSKNSESSNSKCDVNKKSDSPLKDKLLSKSAGAEKNERENYSVASNIGKAKQLKSVHSMSKNSTNKTSKTDKKMRQTEIQANSNLSESNHSQVSGLAPVKEQEKPIKTSSCDTVLKKIEEKGIKLLTRTQQPISNFKKADEVNKALHKKTPSKIPTRSIKYGPPAPFSQSKETSKIKTKSMVPHQVNCSRGDTNEGTFVVNKLLFDFNEANWIQDDLNKTKTNRKMIN